jgi:phosphatidylglycerol:prolipoprotein diacylglycerol transferase
MEFLAKSGVMIEDLFGIDIYWYGVLIATGFLLAYFNTSFLCKKRGYKSDLTTDMLIICIVGAIVGARSYYVAFEFDTFLVKNNVGATLLNIIDIRQGGLAIYGGIIGAVLGLLIYAKVKKLNILALMDVCAASLALGQAIGRWGNFFNQEAHGALVTNEKLQFFPYAVYLDSPADPSDPAGWYQATFFYESMWCLVIFVLLTLLFFRQKYYGQLTLSYLALYGLERGIVEWLRTDQLLIGGLPVSAMLSLLLCIGASITLLILKIKKYQKPLPYFKKGEKPAEAEPQKAEEEQQDA